MHWVDKLLPKGRAGVSVPCASVNKSPSWLTARVLRDGALTLGMGRMLQKSGMVGWEGWVMCRAADRVGRRDKETCLRTESIITAGACAV